MKTTESKGFGLIGIKVELSWTELMAISGLANSLKGHYDELSEQSGHVSVSKGQLLVANKCLAASIFLSKLAKNVDVQKAADELFSIEGDDEVAESEQIMP